MTHWVLHRYALTMVTQCIWEASHSTSLPSGIAGNMDQEVRALLAALGSCSCLKHTPIPLAYVIHLRCGGAAPSVMCM